MFGGKAIETRKDIKGLSSSFYSTVSLGKAGYLSEALELIKCSHLLLHGCCENEMKNSVQTIPSMRTFYKLKLYCYAFISNLLYCNIAIIDHPSSSEQMLL